MMRGTRRHAALTVRLTVAICQLYLFVHAAPSVAQTVLAGPSFSCPVPRDPLAQLICATPGLWRSDLELVQAYQALRQQLGTDQQAIQALRQQSIDFGLSVRSTCGIATAQSPNATGPLPPPAPPGAVTCIAQAYNWQAIGWRNRLTGAAAQEAARPVEALIEAQRALQRLGLLSSQDPADGVFGPSTRAAITAWQSATGRTPTGLLGDADAPALLSSALAGVSPGDALYRAALQEDALTTLRLATSGDVEARDASGTTALKRAIGAGEDKIAVWLLARGANPNARDDTGGSPLDTAAALGNTTMVRALRAKSAAFWQEDGAAPLSGALGQLFAAVADNNPAGAQAALDAGAAVNGRDSAHMTPLHLAAALEASDIAQLLLIHGAKVDAENSIGVTPLMLASPRSAELLLAMGADPNASTQFGLTPLFYAAYFGRAETLTLLLAHGANPDAQTRQDQTAAQAAAYSPYLVRLGVSTAFRNQMTVQLQAASAGQRPPLGKEQAEREERLKLAVLNGAKARRQARRQEMVKRFGAFADAVMAGEVNDGMSAEMVAAARGTPERKLPIPPVNEVWVYRDARVAFTDGKVTHVGH